MSRAGEGGMGENNGKERALAQVLWAVRNDDVNALVKVIHEQDDYTLINAADYDKRTPLHVAASNNSLKAASKLLSVGACVDALDRWNNTPMANAQSSGFQDMVKLLKFNGARLVAAADASENSSGSPRSKPPSPHRLDWMIDPREIDLSESLLIGKGSFGEIRQATWRGTKVAVKSIRHSLSKDRLIVSDFLNEVDLLVKLRHPNIVQFLGAVTAETPLLLVTEYLAGGDLHALLKKGALPAEMAIAFALDMARGMAYLHCGPNVVIHRDLKPRNLILDEANELKVGDFGLSKLVKVKHVHDVYKLTGETGSYRYMAPEVFLHENYNTKVDVFSYAMILYEMFEGHAPFDEEDAHEAARFMAKENRRPFLSNKIHYPDGMVDLIKQCWSEYPSKRPDFIDIIQNLEKIQEGMPKLERHCFRHLLRRVHHHHD